MGLGCMLGVSAQYTPCQVSDRVLGVPSVTPQADQALPPCLTKMGTELPRSEPGWVGAGVLSVCPERGLGRQSEQTELLCTGDGALLCARLCSALHEGPCGQMRLEFR